MKPASTAAAVAVIAILILPAASFAQSSGGSSGGSSAGSSSGSAAGSPSAGSAGAGSQGVSGVPSGPAAPGGLNNAGEDPSGAGNASRLNRIHKRCFIPETRRILPRLACLQNLPPQIPVEIRQCHLAIGIRGQFFHQEVREEPLRVRARVG